MPKLTNIINNLLCKIINIQRTSKYIYFINITYKFAKFTKFI